MQVEKNKKKATPSLGGAFRPTREGSLFEHFLLVGLSPDPEKRERGPEILFRYPPVFTPEASTLLKNATNTPSSTPTTSPPSTEQKTPDSGSTASPKRTR